MGHIIDQVELWASVAAIVALFVVTFFEKRAEKENE